MFISRSETSHFCATQAAGFSLWPQARLSSSAGRLRSAPAVNCTAVRLETPGLLAQLHTSPGSLWTRSWSAEALLSAGWLTSQLVSGVASVSEQSSCFCCAALGKNRRSIAGLSASPSSGSESMDLIYRNEVGAGCLACSCAESPDRILRKRHSPDAVAGGAGGGGLLCG